MFESVDTQADACTDGWTDGRRLGSHPISSPCAGELKSRKIGGTVFYPLLLQIFIGVV